MFQEPVLCAEDTFTISNLAKESDRGNVSAEVFEKPSANVPEAGSKLQKQSDQVTTIGPEPLLTGVDTNGPWKGVLYGFWPALILVLGMVVVLATLNTRWASDGSLGFQELHGRTVVAGARLESSGLLLWRLACLMLSVAPLVLSVRRYNAKEKEPHEILPFFFCGGMEILLVYFTLWTWCIITIYFLLASSASFVYVVFGWTPTSCLATSLWIAFDIAFGTSWLVFWAVWLLLLPFAYLAKRKAAVDSLLEPLLLYMHNVNVILLTGEALLSQWNLRVEHSIFPAYVVLAYTVWNWWLKTKTGHWLYFFMDYNRPSMVPTFLILVAVEVASFLAGASLADLGQ